MDRTELYRKLMLTISGNKTVERLSLKYGRKLANRFIAGDTLTEALDEIEELNKKGIMVTLDHLGEGIHQLKEASGYKEEYLRLVDGIASRQVNANVSLKPTQMGLELDKEACYSNIKAVVWRANKHNMFVWIDMENSAFTQTTIDIVHRLHAGGLKNVGTVIQAYLFRTENDVKQLMKKGIQLRLVKGAYKEPSTIAYQQKTEVVSNFRAMIKLHLDQGVFTAVASHDDQIINWVKDYARAKKISKDAFEFQMLYGLRMNEQEKLAQEGYQMRCYLPYGILWYPYYTRRLAEKPANLILVIRHMFKA